MLVDVLDLGLRVQQPNEILTVEKRVKIDIANAFLGCCFFPHPRSGVVRF